MLNLKNAISRAVIATALVSTSLSLVGCGSGTDNTGAGATFDAPESGENMGSIAEVASGKSNLSTFVGAVQSFGLASIVDDTTRVFTAFAPDNAALENFEADSLSAYNALPQAYKAKVSVEEFRKNVLKFHLINGAELSSVDAIGAAGSTIRMGEGSQAAVYLKDLPNDESDELKLVLNGVPVTEIDIAADNGVIHVLEGFIVPSLPAPGGDDKVAQPTVAQVLMLANATDADITAMDLKGSVEALSETNLKLPEFIGAEYSFNTLLSLLGEAGLAELFSDRANDEKYTVFAPTDAAFASLPAETVALLQMEKYKDALAYILKDHVIAKAQIDSVNAMAAHGSDVTMLGGLDAEILETEMVLSIAGAKVVTADVHALNAIVHVIDSVIGVEKAVEKIAEIDASMDSEAAPAM